MSKWLNRAVFKLPRNGTSTHTFDFSSSTNLVSGAAFTPTAGNRLVAVVTGAPTSTCPVGWSQVLTAVSNTGTYMFTRWANTIGTSFSLTHNGSNYPVLLAVYEFPRETAYGYGIAAVGASATSAIILANTNAALNQVIAFKSGIRGSGANVGTFAWTGSGSPVEDFDLGEAFATTDGYMASLAYVDDYVGSTWQPTATSSESGTFEHFNTNFELLPTEPLGGTLAVRGVGIPSGATQSVNSVSPVTHASTTADDLVVLAVAAKPYSTVITTPTGWTKVGEYTNGTVASANDTGSTKIAVYVREGLVGTNVIPAIGQTGASSMVAGCVTYSKPAGGYTWDHSVFGTAGDNSNSTSFQTFTGSIGPLSERDWVVACSAINSDSGTISGYIFNLGDSAVSAGQALYTKDNTNTGYRSRIDQVVTTGNDGRLLFGDAEILAGRSTDSDVSLAYGNLAVSSGSVLFLRIRAVPPASDNAGTLVADTPLATASISGASKNSGSLSAAVPKATASIAEVVQSNSATLAAAVPKLTGAISGASRNAGSLVAAVPDVTSSISGSAKNAGSVAAAVPVLTGSVSGSSRNAGSVAAAVPLLQASVSESATNAGSLVAVVPKLSGSVSGASKNAGSLAAVLPDLTGAVAGGSTNAAALAGVAPLLEAAVAEVQTQAGSLAGSVPLARAALSGSATNSGSLSGGLPRVGGAVATAFASYRFQPTALRSGGTTEVQLSEFQLLVGGARVAGATAYGVGNNSPANEEPAKLNDSNPTSKWLNFNGTSGYVYLDFPSAFAADGFRIATANDADGRDPVAFDIYGSNDSAGGTPGTWTLIGSFVMATNPGRNTFLPDYRFPWPVAVEQQTQLASLAASLPLATSAIAGSTDISGSLIAAVPKVTGSLSGSATNVGSLVASTPKVTGSAAGASRNSGVLAAAAPKLTASIIEVPPIVGSLVASVPKATAAVSGQFVILGSLVASTPIASASAAGSMVNSGSLAASVPKPTAVITDTSKNIGSMNAALPVVRAAVSGSATLTGSLSTSVPRVSSSLVASSTNAGSLVAVAPLVLGSLPGQLIIGAALGASVPKLTASVSGSTNNSATMNVAVPRLAGSVAGLSTMTGALAGSVPRAAGSFIGASVLGAVLSAVLLRPAGSLPGSLWVSAAVSASVPRVTAGLAGILRLGGNLTAATPKLQASIAGSWVLVGSLDAVLPLLQLDVEAVFLRINVDLDVGSAAGSGFQVVDADGATEAPMVSGSGFVIVDVDGSPESPGAARHPFSVEGVSS
jgi:hypothetical protein